MALPGLTVSGLARLSQSVPRVVRQQTFVAQAAMQTLFRPQQEFPLIRLSVTKLRWMSEAICRFS